MLERGYQPLNAGREPVVNRFLMFCNKAKLKHLLRGLVVWLVSSSLLISYIFKRRGCVGADVTFPNCVLLVLSMLIGGGGPDLCLRIGQRFRHSLRCNRQFQKAKRLQS